jgi:hypothetical protein
MEMVSRDPRSVALRRLNCSNLMDWTLHSPSISTAFYLNPAPYPPAPFLCPSCSFPISCYSNITKKYLSD